VHLGTLEVLTFVVCRREINSVKIFRKVMRERRIEKYRSGKDGYRFTQNGFEKKVFQLVSVRGRNHVMACSSGKDLISFGVIFKHSINFS